MAAQSSTSVRLPDDMRKRYDELARLTGQTRNALIVRAMEQFVEQKMRELAMIQEGFDQIDRSETVTLDDVVADFAARGVLNREAYDRDRERRVTM